MQHLVLSLMHLHYVKRSFLVHLGTESSHYRLILPVIIQLNYCTANTLSPQPSTSCQSSWVDEILAYSGNCTDTVASPVTVCSTHIRLSPSQTLGLYPYRQPEGGRGGGGG